MRGKEGVGTGGVEVAVSEGGKKGSKGGKKGSKDRETWKVFAALMYADVRISRTNIL